MKHQVDSVIVVDFSKDFSATSDLYIPYEELLRPNLWAFAEDAYCGREGILEQDYLRPAWTYKRSLFVWCDEHFRWNEHGAADTERKRGRLTSRSPHHFDCDAHIYYCMGEADKELAKILRRYPKGKFYCTPPPIRRVYVSNDL